MNLKYIFAQFSQISWYDFAERCGKARSLTQNCKKFNPEKSLLTSLDEMSERHLPLYAFWKFREWVNQ